MLNVYIREAARGPQHLMSPLPPQPVNNHSRPPLLFVTHLPSASSFYASIIQPLGLQFLSSPKPQFSTVPPTPPVLNYGYLTQGPAGLKSVIVFSITQGRPGVRGKIRLSASSEEAVTEFWKKSAVVNKGIRTPGKLDYLAENEEEGEIVIARTRDFDGNMLEAVYRPRDRGYGYGGGGVPRREVIETAATEKEARRVLEWQEQVARSIGESGGSGGAASVISEGGEGGYRPVAVRRADSYPVQGSERAVPMRLVRRDTVTTEHYRRPDERGEGGRGISGKAVIGTLLGAAAGAAIAYAMVRSESPERRPAVAPRRASYGNQMHYTQIAQTPMQRERLPARSYVSARDEGRPRYADVEYVDQAPRVHQIDDKSYVSQRPSRSVHGGSRARSRSEVGPRYERPLTIQPARTESSARSPSHLSQRSSYKTARERSPSRSRHTGSHVSTRSHHSHSTAKQSPPPPVATSTIKIRSMPMERERRVMHSGFERDVERAREVPLPVSVVSGMGYAASVAPSDSVSSVGIKRERERLRERMSIRDGARGGW
jgi:hypothetical protein